MAFTLGASERAATAVEKDDAAFGTILDDEETREDSDSLGTASICAGSEELTDEDGTDMTLPEGRRSSKLPAVPDDATTEPDDRVDDEEVADIEEDGDLGRGRTCCGARKSPISAAVANRGAVFCLFDMLIY